MTMITSTQPQIRSSARWAGPDGQPAQYTTPCCCSCLPIVQGSLTLLCVALLCLQNKYVVLTKADINRRQQEVIDAVTSVLGISHDDAGRILRKYKWWVPMQPSKQTTRAYQSKREFFKEGPFAPDNIPPTRVAAPCGTRPHLGSRALRLSSNPSDLAAAAGCRQHDDVFWACILTQRVPGPSLSCISNRAKECVCICICCRDANRVNEEWFTDMDKVRESVGMVDEAPEPPGSTDKVRHCWISISSA